MIKSSCVDIEFIERIETTNLTLKFQLHLANFLYSDKISLGVFHILIKVQLICLKKLREFILNSEKILQKRLLKKYLNQFNNNNNVARIYQGIPLQYITSHR
jgi:hypothetical protein